MEFLSQKALSPAKWSPIGFGGRLDAPLRPEKARATGAA